MSQAAIVGLSGPVLTPDERDLLRRHQPLGVILFRRNIVSKPQLAELTSRIRDALPEGGLLMVDQEGGRVARLQPPHWRAHPPAAAIGRLHARDPAAGERASFLTGALIGIDCASAGFDVACAPVLDREVPGAHAVIGDRAFAAEPARIAALAGAFARGLLQAGVQPVGKHVPGHGRAGLDSHLALPELDRIEAEDLESFAALRWLPWMMTAHIRYRADDPENPATWSRPILQRTVRGRLGFDNLLISDDLAMQALDGPPGQRAARAIAAGCDIALHCSGVLEESLHVVEAVPALSAEVRGRLGRAWAMRAEAMLADAPDGAAMAQERAGLLC